MESRKKIINNAMEGLYREYIALAEEAKKIDDKKKELSKNIKTYLLGLENRSVNVDGQSLYLQEKDTKSLNDDLLITKIKGVCKKSELKNYITTKEIILEDNLELGIMNGSLGLTQSDYDSCINHKITYALCIGKSK